MVQAQRKHISLRFFSKTGSTVINGVEKAQADCLSVCVAFPMLRTLIGAR